MEADRFHVDINVQQFRASALDRHGAVDYVRATALRIKSQILNAVLIPAGIVNFAGMDTHGFPYAAQVLDGAGQYSF